METLHGEQQSCCRWAPRQTLWCFLEKAERNDTWGWCSSLGELYFPLFSPFISTTSTGTCFSLMRKISKLVTTPWKGSKITLKISLFFFKPNPVFPPFFYFISVPAFLLESCLLSHTDNLRFSASAVCSQPHWRGCGHGSPGGKATASESLWLGCLCPQVPRMLWCCHQATMKNLCRQKFKVKP